MERENVIFWWLLALKKKVDLKALSLLFGLNKLRFASPKRLMRYLGVDPGAVSILGIIKDSNREVEVIFDKNVWRARAFQCHPLVNTSTLLISKDEIRRFLVLTGHEPCIMDVPHHPQKHPLRGQL